MQIVFTAREIIASLNMGSSVVSELRFLDKKKFEKISLELFTNKDAIERAWKAQSMEEANVIIHMLNQELKKQDDKLCTSRLGVDGDSDIASIVLIIEFDSAKTVEMMELVTEQVGTLAGIAMTIAGLLKTFGSSLKNLGRRLDAIANRD